jgi:hypothetical protein
VKPSSHPGVASLVCSLLLLLMAGCPAPPAPTFATLDPANAPPREVKTLVGHRTSQALAAEDIAATDAGVVALRAPPGQDVAFATVATFFRALTREDFTMLATTTDGHATLSNLKLRARIILPGRHRRFHAGHIWRGRFRKRVFEKLAGAVIYRPGDILVYDRDSYPSLPRRLRRSYTQRVGPRDLVLRVPIISHSLDNQRYFAEEMTFWLKRQAGGYLIAHIAEVFPF